MNRLRLAILATIAIGMTQAEYIVQYRLTNLPSGSIQLITPASNAGNWGAAEPVYTEWVLDGDVYDCNWVPATSTVLTGTSFTQTASSCKQDKTRNKQSREQDSKTLEYRNVGSATIEKETTTTNSSKQSIGTGTKTTECSYSFNVAGVLDNYWFSGTSTNNLYMIKVNGIQLKNEYGYTKTSVNINGIDYSRGNVRSPYAGGDYREVCIGVIK